MISLHSKAAFITSQCTVSSVSLLLGRAVLQAIELWLRKFFQGKIKKDEQEVLIASNWEEECKSSSAATASRSVSSGLHNLPVRNGQRRSFRSCGITPSSSPPTELFPAV